MLSQFSIRCALFPLTVIKTQLQVQFKNDAYNGMIDAFIKIYKKDGVKGLYRGFFVSSFQIVSGVFYITTYEATRQFLNERGCNNKNIKALVSGGMASLAGQTIIVPFDVISQHIMILGMDVKGKRLNPLKIDVSNQQNKSRLAVLVAKEIIRKDGFMGFYRGYMASLLAYVPNSALWWGFYQLYQGT
jgi:solute carrier family 25, member 44